MSCPLLRVGPVWEPAPAGVAPSAPLTSHTHPHPAQEAPHRWGTSTSTSPILAPPWSSVRRAGAAGLGELPWPPTARLVPRPRLVPRHRWPAWCVGGCTSQASHVPMFCTWTQCPAVQTQSGDEARLWCGLSFRLTVGPALPATAWGGPYESFPPVGITGTQLLSQQASRSAGHLDLEGCRGGRGRHHGSGRTLLSWAPSTSPSPRFPARDRRL